MTIKTVVVGASGLVGGELLNILLASPGYEGILILVRKELPVKHNKLTQLVVDLAGCTNIRHSLREMFCFATQVRPGRKRRI